MRETKEEKDQRKDRQRSNIRKKWEYEKDGESKQTRFISYPYPTHRNIPGPEEKLPVQI